MKYKFNYYVLMPLFLFSIHPYSYATDESKKAKVDAVMSKAARQASEELVGMKVDEHTRIRIIAFDKAVPVFMYIYSADIGSTSLSADQKKAMEDFHLNKTCESKFRPLMKNPYNLKVLHEFEDVRTGKSIYKIIIGDKNCLLR